MVEAAQQDDNNEEWPDEQIDGLALIRDEDFEQEDEEEKGLALEKQNSAINLVKKTSINQQAQAAQLRKIDSVMNNTTQAGGLNDGSPLPVGS